jgi:hypothetical protein
MEIRILIVTATMIALFCRLDQVVNAFEYVVNNFCNSNHSKTVLWRGLLFSLVIYNWLCVVQHTDSSGRFTQIPSLYY